VENGTVLSFVACLEEKKLYEFRSLREYNGGTKASLPFFFLFFFGNTLHHWIATLDYPNLLGFHDFLDIFFFFLSMYLFCIFSV
jgi:hypothetical protein